MLNKFTASEKNSVTVYLAEGKEFYPRLNKFLPLFLRVAQDSFDKSKWRLDRTDLGPWEAVNSTHYNTPEEAAKAAACFKPKPFKA